MSDLTLSPFYTAIQTQFVGSGTPSWNASVPPKGTWVKTLRIHWDGDKVRGITYTDNANNTYSAADNNNDQYASSTYTFSVGETLQTLSLWSSSYGYGSWRGIRFTTSLGHNFSAGASGGNSPIDLSSVVKDSILLGFCGTINPDNFMNSIALWVTEPASSIELSGVEYQLDKATISNSQFQFLDNLTLENDSDIPQTISTQHAETYSSTSSWSTTWGVKVGIKVSFSGGIPLIAKNKVEISVEGSWEYTQGGTLETSSSYQLDASTTVPAHSIVNAVCQVTKSQLAVPFTTNAKVYFGSNTTPVILQDYQGTFTGVSSHDIQVTYSSPSTSLGATEIKPVITFSIKPKSLHYF